MCGEQGQAERKAQMKRTSLIAIFALLMVLALAPAASAGEVKGPSGPDGAQGGTTPIDNFWSGGGAASICSFSGLNDVIVTDPEDPGFEPTRTQSYGTFIVLFGKDNVDNNPEGGPPGLACNPTKGPNPKGVGR